MQLAGAQQCRMCILERALRSHTPVTLTNAKPKGWERAVGGTASVCTKKHVCSVYRAGAAS